MKSLAEKANSYIRQLGTVDQVLLTLTILLLVFDLLQLVLANRAWVWEFTTFIPWYVIVLAHLALLIPMIVRGEGWLIAMLVVATLIQVRILDFGFPKVIQPDQSLPRITVFNWNTEFWEPDESETRLFQHLSNNRADIIHLQEAMELNGEARPVEEKVKQILGEEYTVVQYGELVSATKLPVIDIQASDLGAFQRMDLEVNGTTISVYNVHIPVHVIPRLIKEPQNMVSYVRDRFYRRQQASAALIAELESNPNPKIISGDFNSQTSMPLIHYYVDHFREAARDTTFGIPTSIKLGGVKLWRIDYVFGHKVSFTNYQEVDPQQLSDHWGQRAEFVIQN
jgi:endonuclease/exonuclease/phosphatase family metal-dependent hydrolase